MAKVIIFSRVFPSYHPKSGQPTYFVEKFLKGLENGDNLNNEVPLKKQLPLILDFKEDLHPKYHTIRAGNRWKAGDKFSPRVWSGTPYKSKMISIAPDTEIKWVADFEIAENWLKILPGDYDYNIIIDHLGYYNTSSPEIKEITKNDGLSLGDFLQWFKYPSAFKGQIICWNKNIKY